MKPRVEAISFSLPLREVRRVTPALLAAEQASRRQAELRDAHERGKREGENALSQQLIQQRAELQELQNGVLESLRQSVRQVVAESEQTLVALTLEIAQKLVGSLAITGEMVEAAVREALSQIEANTRIKVFLHQEDLALLQKISSSLLAPGSDGDAMQIAVSSEVTRGGCIVETGFGRIDGRRETKLELLRQSLEA